METLVATALRSLGALTWHFKTHFKTKGLLKFVRLANTGGVVEITLPLKVVGSKSKPQASFSGRVEYIDALSLAEILTIVLRELAPCPPVELEPKSFRNVLTPRSQSTLKVAQDNQAQPPSAIAYDAARQIDAPS